MSIAVSFPSLPPPRLPTRRGRPAAPLPAGLPDDVIQKIRRRSERMARANNGASFPLIFAAKTFAALAEHGFARLSTKQVMSLARAADELPAELCVICVAFIGSHPPVNADYSIMSEAIRRGAVGGVPGLKQLHHHIRDRQRKAAEARAKRMRLNSLPSPSRPRLLSKEERAAAMLKRAEAEIEEANAALAKL